MSLDNQKNGWTWRNSRYGFAAAFGLSLGCAFSGLRLALLLAFGPETPPTFAELLRLFLAGLHRDVLVAFLFTLPLLGWFCVMPERWFSSRWHRVLLRLGLFLFWFVQVFVLLAEYYFFEEFRSRYNTVAVDYLLYPHEVFNNIWDDYPVAIIWGICGALSLGWLIAASRLFSGMWQQPVSRWHKTLGLAGPLAIAIALGFTINLRGPQIAKDRLLNELANNGALSFFAALWTNHLDYTAFYQTLPKDEAYQRARHMLAEPGATFTEPGESIQRRIAGDAQRPRLNVVIFLEESLGSEFWGSLGRTNATLTPEMDRLAAEDGILFTNLYASGNRTVRGFEGVLSAFPPLPGDSIVKRDQSKNVETIARVLKRDGYETLFLYGGRGVFDGMRGFTLNNGYDRFIEQKHFAKPTFATIWGICDEDVFQRGLEEFRALSLAGKPFLGTILSVSNHKPYTYPPGRIPEDPHQRRRENAVKYSDYCLGEFFRQARKEPFWTNTVFVVVADHGARVYGSQSIPMHSYEIPLLIAGPAVVKAPQRISQLGCSLDVTPTILGLIDRPYDSLFLGRDLLKAPSEPGRAFMHHNRDVGMFSQDRLVVLGLKQHVQYYAGDPKKGEIKPLTSAGPLEEELRKDTVALYQVADDLYIHQRYHLDPE